MTKENRLLSDEELKATFEPLGCNECERITEKMTTSEANDCCQLCEKVYLVTKQDLKTRSETLREVSEYIKNVPNPYIGESRRDFEYARNLFLSHIAKLKNGSMPE